MVNPRALNNLEEATLQKEEIFKELENKEITEVLLKDEEEIKTELEFPLKDGKYIEKGVKCYCIVKNKIHEGTVLGYAKFTISVPYNKEKNYEFIVPAHKIRLEISGKEIEHPTIFKSRKDAEILLERIKSNGTIPIAYHITRTSPDPFEN